MTDRSSPDDASSPPPNRWVAAWALLGVGAILVDAIIRLGIRALEHTAGGLSPVMWGWVAVSVVLFGYGEGVMALKRKWVPSVVRRAEELSRSTNRLHWLLAPLYGMSMVGAPRRTLIRAWVGVALLVAVILVVRTLPYGPRAAIDIGVAVALSVGLTEVIRGLVRVTRTGSAPVARLVEGEGGGLG